MTTLGWMAASGLLLLVMSLTSAYVRRLPISTGLIYLFVGVVIGPAGLDLVRIDLARDHGWFERLAEIALIISLFVGGLKLRVPVRDTRWRAALRLAGPAMLACIVGVAIAAHLLLGMPPALALLAGAVLAPTDPVLAATVAVDDAKDDDRVRFALSGEAGLNDGMAFPFVMFALQLMSQPGELTWIPWWAARYLLWAVPVGLLVGYLLGRLVGLAAIRMRSRQRDSDAPSDFLALALIALSYVIAEWMHGWGFLAAFAAGVGLRHVELRVVRESPLPASLVRRLHRRAVPADGPATPSASHPPAEELVRTSVDQAAMEQPAVAAGVLIAETLSFGDTIERLLEVLLVVMVGILLSAAWSWEAMLLGALLFAVIRPASVMLLLAGTRTSVAQRAVIGWFGLRGIGSLYYLTYAMSHGVGGETASRLVSTVITVVAASIVLHGVSSTPVIAWYERGKRTRSPVRQARLDAR